MGQWLSSTLDYSLVSESNSTEALAETPAGDKRVLNIDPRSPTVNINRTPIEVNKTPKAAGAGDAGDNSSPLTSMQSGRPRSLHQRIMEKRKKEADA